jgi:hypothetical protein
VGIFLSFSLANESDMKNWAVCFVMLAAVACSETEVVNEFTGRETVYALQPASAYAVSGTVTFKERKDGHTTVSVELSGTSGPARHPVHLHLGDLATPDADIAALLTPVAAATGKSETTLAVLADESAVTYDALMELRASVKIHLADTGPERDIILAAGNIGRAFTEDVASGRTKIALCQSN